MGRLRGDEASTRPSGARLRACGADEAERRFRQGVDSATAAGNIEWRGRSLMLLGILLAEQGRDQASTQKDPRIIRRCRPGRGQFPRSSDAGHAAPDSPRSCHARTKNGTVTGMTGAPIIDIVFFRTESGQEPVRDWLKSLSKVDKRVIGADLKTVQYGWPIGIPVVRKLEAGLWEVRSRLDRRIARILFTVTDGRMILLHGFIKKSQKTPADDLALARRRRTQLTPGPHSP